MNASVVSRKWLKVVVVAVLLASLSFVVGLGSKIWLAQAQTNDMVLLNNDPNAPTVDRTQKRVPAIPILILRSEKPAMCRLLNLKGSGSTDPKNI